MLKYGIQGLFTNQKITFILIYNKLSYFLIWILIYVFFLNLSF